MQHYYVRGPLWRAKAVNLKLLTDYFTEAQTFWIVLVFVLCDFTVYGWLLIYFCEIIVNNCFKDYTFIVFNKSVFS